MAYRVHWEGDTVVFTFSEVLCDEDLLGAAREAYDADRTVAMTAQLVDMTAAERIDVTSAGVQEVARMDAESSKNFPDVRVAVVTTSKLLHGLSRMRELTISGSTWETQIFDSLDEARAWLASSEEA